MRKKSDSRPEKETSASQGTGDLHLRLMPPLVNLPRPNGRCRELFENICNAIAPEAVAGRQSAITERELEDCVCAAAIALCWHLAAFGDRNRRERVIEKVMDETAEVTVAIEAAGIAMKKGITIAEALNEIFDSMQLDAGETHGDGQLVIEIQAVEDPQGQTHDRTAAQPSEAEENATDRSSAESRLLPQMVMPAVTPMRCCELVNRLLSTIDAEIKPGHVSVISDDEIEERVAACQLAMCWFLGALNDDPTALHPLERFWLGQIPQLVSATMAVRHAEEKRMTVSEAIREICPEVPEYEMQMSDKTCFIWVAGDGKTRMSGPDEVLDEMNEYIRAADFLRAVSHAIGENVNRLDLNTLDKLLAQHHVELANLVPDGDFLDMSPQQYDAFIAERAFWFNRALKAAKALRLSGLSADMRGIRRSFLIRAHMIRAKIEAREQRKTRPH